MTTKIALCGAMGKVGRVFLQYFSKIQHKSVELSLIIIKNRDSEYKQFCDEFKSLFDKLKVLTSEQELKRFKDDFDVVIDFSTPISALKRAGECCSVGKPFITGTTGFSKSDLDNLINYAQTIPVIIAQNFTWGINYIFSVLKNTAKLIPENFFVEVYESHSPGKVDSPSGTAKRIIEILQTGKFFNNVYINSFNLPLTPQDLQVLVSRNSQNVNQHKVVIRGPFEEVTISHQTFSREVYIEPALKTAILSSKLKPGLYYFENITEHLREISLV